MLFNSLQFLVFFPIVTVLYFTIPHRFRWFLLLLASCLFYMAFIPVYILILAATIIIDYFAGILIENSKSTKEKKIFLIFSIIFTCLILFIFKYFNFFNTNFSYIATLLHWNYSISALKIILPIGLSFHTFQSMSYVIEVYKNRQKAERHFGVYALYVMFYPQLVAGPIERPQNLLHQFYEKHNFDYERITSGLKLMLWGFFKKVVIADKLAIIVNLVYDNPADYTGLPLILATIFFAFQIYCDFSGYSDIAIGAAQVMGFKLMDNFKRPYSSRSISEFWKRWHISLSTWFRDYVYIPLGGNRVNKYHIYLNIFIVFLISGLWHGANWTFVIWGALHGIYLIFEIITKTSKEKFLTVTKLIEFPKLIHLYQICSTFILVTFGWIFFRANNLSDAIYIITHLFSNITFNIKELLPGFSWIGIVYSFFLIGFMEFIHLIQAHISIRSFLNNKPLVVRWVIYLILILLIALFGVFNNTKFIYFQF